MYIIVSYTNTDIDNKIIVDYYMYMWLQTSILILSSILIRIIRNIFNVLK